MGNLLESSCIENTNPVLQSESCQSIENYVESLAITNNWDKENFQERTKLYKEIIAKVIDELKNIKTELFNHEITLHLKPVQGK